LRIAQLGIVADIPTLTPNLFLIIEVVLMPA